MIPSHAARAELLSRARALITRSRELVAESRALIAGSQYAISELWRMRRQFMTRTAEPLEHKNWPD